MAGGCPEIPFGLCLGMSVTPFLQSRSTPTTAERWGVPFGITPGRNAWSHVETSFYRSPDVKHAQDAYTRRAGLGEATTLGVKPEEPHLNVWGHAAVWRSALLGRAGTPNTPARGVVRPLGVAYPPDTGTQPS